MRGSLRPDVARGGLDVRFVDGDGQCIVDYAGLAVCDASGRALAASFAAAAGRLELAIDTREARYPLTVDPVAQQAYLKASNPDPGDFFGSAVAVSGDTVVIGAYNEDSAASGVNGDESDNSLPNAGAAYVFVRNGTSWSQQAYLKASNPTDNDLFGRAVAIHGGTIVVGAPAEDGATTLGTGENGAKNSGAAYVFVRNGTTWSQQAYLKASNVERGDDFGWSVAIDGETIAVGAIREASSAAGVNGNQFDNSAPKAGAVYLLHRQGGRWSQTAYVKASNPDAGDEFGYSVALSGETLLVGAPFEASSATGVNGNQADNSAYNAGAAYVFVRNGSTWIQQAYLKASNTDPQDQFGFVVSLSGDLAVATAFNEQSNATGINGGQSNNSLYGAGAAYFFRRAVTTWAQEAYVKASNTNRYYYFGSSAGAFGDLVVIGSMSEGSRSTGINGSQAFSGTNLFGAAYLFAWNGSVWRQQAYIKPSNTGIAADFGFALGADGDTVVVGADLESSTAFGVNGNQMANGSPGSGAAYVFDVPPRPVESIRAGMPANPIALQRGVTSGPAIGATWDPRVDHTTFAPNASMDVLLIAPPPGINVPTSIGTLLCQGTPSVALTSPAGVAFSVPIPANVGLVGVRVCSQAASVSSSPPAIALTNALDIVVGDF